MFPHLSSVPPIAAQPFADSLCSDRLTWFPPCPLLPSPSRYKSLTKVDFDLCAACVVKHATDHYLAIIRPIDTSTLRSAAAVTAANACHDLDTTLMQVCMLFVRLVSVNHSALAACDRCGQSNLSLLALHSTTLICPPACTAA